MMISPTPNPPTVTPTGLGLTEPLTSALLREFSEVPRPDSLIAVGLALHHFTELIDELIELDPIELHRATTVLTKQITRALATPEPLSAVRELVTDPLRPATIDHQTARQLCGETAWATLRDLADARAASAIDGVETFGESAVLHLAATRAVRPRCTWWGTAGWTLRVDAWADDNELATGSRRALISAPEYVDDEVLREIVTDDDAVSTPRLAPLS
jgi:hypothetical protein